MPGTVVAEGVVVVEADAKGVGSQIAKDVQSGAGAAGQSGMSVGRSVFGGVVAGFAAVGGAEAIVGGISNAIGGASDLNETLSKSSAIFGANAGAIESWGNTAAKNLGLSKGDAIAAAAGFGDMFTQLGFAGDAASSMSQQVVQASADLGSFNNLETADVAERMSAAFRGEYDSLQAVIPNINAARVESEALAATGKTVASELTAQEKAAAVLAIVQKDGARAMGDFAKTSDGAANSAKIASASLEDQGSKLGAVLLPAWTQFLSFVNTNVVPAFGWLIDNIPLVGSVLGGLAVALIVAFAPAIWAAVVATWAFTAALLANPLTWIVIAITAVVAGIIWLATQTTFFQDLWKGAMEVIGAIFNWLWVSVIKPVADWISGAIGFIGTAIKVLWILFVQPYINLIGGVFNWLWTSVIQPVGAWIGGAFEAIGSTVEKIFGGIGTFIKDTFDNIVDFIKGPINVVIGFINKAIVGANLVGAAFGVNIPQIPLLAKGGTITGAGSVIVGERGPEILNLPRGASVVPLTGAQRSQGTGGDAPLIGGDLIINEAEDPLGSAGRIDAELRKFRKR